MSEQDPSLNIKLGGNDFEMNRSNSFLFTFLGDLAIHDHVFLLTQEDRSRGAYIFKVCHPEPFRQLGEYMLANDYMAHLNLQEVCDGDADAFRRATMGDLLSESGIPESWDGTADS